MPTLRIVSAPLLFLSLPLLASAFAPPFVEEFNDNKAEWLAKAADKTVVEKIENGKFHFENLSAEANSVKWRSVPVAIESNQDFEIALRATMSDATADSECGLIWDYNSQQNFRRHFHLQHGGTYSIFSSDGKNYAASSQGRKNPKIKPDGENELIIRKIGLRVFYLINGSAVDVTDFTAFHGNFIGVVISSGATLDSDHFHVRYLEGAPETHVTEARKLEADARAALLASGPPLEDMVETFDDNHHQWQNIGQGDGWSSRIANGVLEWTNKQTGDAKQRTVMDLQINRAADYEFTCRLKRVAGAEDTLFGVSWNWSQETGHEFGIAANGNYIFGNTVNGTYDSALPWRETTLVKKNDFNELKARKLGDTFFLFLNGQIVADTPAKAIDGDYLAIVVSQGTTVAFDEIRVTYLKQTEEQTSAEKEKLVAALKAGHGKPGLGIVYSVARRQEIISAQSKKDLQDLEDQRWKLTDADQKQLTKVRKQFEGKKLLSLYADWGRPVTISSDGYRDYYNYKLVGRTQYYYEFQVFKPSSDQKTWVINAVQHTDRRW